jgi:RimJ/RimL family protein N-acetyltransferase
MIRSARLLLRPWRESDRAPFAALNADPEVMAHMPKLLTRAESDASVTRIENHFAAHGFGVFAVESLHDGCFMGFVGLMQPSFETPFPARVEIGWRLARRFWGHGYALEGAQASLQYGFETLALPEIVAMTVLGNERSWTLMERLGMQRDFASDFDHPALPVGHALRPHILYRLSRARWLGDRAAGT